MARVFVARHQDPSRVAASLRQAALRVGGAPIRTDTSGQRMAFIVDSATHESWRNPPKPAVKKSPAKRKASTSQSGPQKMKPVDDATGGER